MSATAETGTTAASVPGVLSSGIETLPADWVWHVYSRTVAKPVFS